MNLIIDTDVLKKIASIIGGDDCVKVALALKDLGEVTDDVLLTKLGINLNEVRKVLFKLYNNSIVLCNQTRDKKTGWFIFSWKLQPEQMESYVSNLKKKVREILKARLEYENQYEFYYCETSGCRRITFEEALESIFRCPTCGKNLLSFDKMRIIKVLQDKIDELSK